MSVDYQIERCRNYYTRLRIAVKSPPMIAFKSSFGWLCEAKDGSITIEYPNQTHCSWCVKSEGVHAWSEKFNQKD